MEDKDLFIKAFLEAEKKDCNPDGSENAKWDFSEKFEKDMEKLILSEGKKHSKRRIRIPISIAAALCALVILITGSVTAFGTRSKGIYFDVIEEGNFFEITLSPESTYDMERIETYYTIDPEVIPDGFGVFKKETDDISGRITWINERGNKIIFEQTLLCISIELYNSEYFEKGKKNGYPMYISSPAKEPLIVWFDDNYAYTICTHSLDYVMSEKEAIKLIRTLSNHLVKMDMED